jgi:hypothetical protein
MTLNINGHERIGLLTMIANLSIGSGKGSTHSGGIKLMLLKLVKEILNRRDVTTNAWDIGKLNLVKVSPTLLAGLLADLLLTALKAALFKAIGGLVE